MLCSLVLVLLHFICGGGHLVVVGQFSRCLFGSDLLSSARFLRAFDRFFCDVVRLFSHVNDRRHCARRYVL